MLTGKEAATQLLHSTSEDYLRGITATCFAFVMTVNDLVEEISPNGEPVSKEDLADVLRKVVQTAVDAHRVASEVLAENRGPGIDGTV